MSNSNALTLIERLGTLEQEVSLTEAALRVAERDVLIMMGQRAGVTVCIVVSIFGAFMGVLIYPSVFMLIIGFLVYLTLGSKITSAETEVTTYQQSVSDYRSQLAQIKAHLVLL